MVDKYLEDNKDLLYITILFISDGRDSEISTLETRILELKGNKNLKQKINFISLGVGKSYPHFLAMKLRNFYCLV